MIFIYFFKFFLLMAANYVQNLYANEKKKERRVELTVFGKKPSFFPNFLAICVFLMWANFENTQYFSSKCQNISL